MPIKKTPKESRTKNVFSGTGPGAGRDAGRVARQATRARRPVSLRDLKPKTGIFTPILQIRPFLTKIKFIQLPHILIASYNFNLYHRLKIGDQIVTFHLNDPTYTNKYKLATCIV